MNKELKCPKCGSSHLDAVELMGSKFIICLNCGYDESEEILDVYPESRGTKGGRGTPYKRGGSMRSVKR
ncbi:MAG TPA: hypothetical protein VJI68_02060 [Candidatus Nanoarchaeia archaeon]|nr:hypothetical protein [Candidatus Nanoarchaeia archaeon]